MDTYVLAQKDILELLARDVNWFSNCVHQNYTNFAREYNFELKTSELRLAESFALWHQDLDRILKLGIEESKELDPYKQAGFLAYWLRRRVVINDIQLYAETEDPSPPKLADHQNTLPSMEKRFFNFYNEICAFRLGLDISIFYATSTFCNRLAKKGVSADDIEVASLAYIREISKKGNSLVVDTSVLMKQKNLSPHALYIIYKSLV